MNVLDSDRKAAADRRDAIRSLTLDQIQAGVEALRRGLSDPHLSVQENREAEIVASIFVSILLAKK